MGSAEEGYRNQLRCQFNLAVPPGWLLEICSGFHGCQQILPTMGGKRFELTFRSVFCSRDVSTRSREDSY